MTRDEYSVGRSREKYGNPNAEAQKKIVKVARPKRAEVPVKTDALKASVSSSAPTTEVGQEESQPATTPTFGEIPMLEPVSGGIAGGGSVAILRAPSVGLTITSIIPARGKAPVAYYQVDQVVYSGEDGQADAVEALVQLGRVRKG